MERAPATTARSWFSQVARVGIGFALLAVLAQVAATISCACCSPAAYAASGCVLLVVVALTGDIGKGAQRWLDLGVIRFQPSEIMKLAVPMIVRLVPARAAAAAGAARRRARCCCIILRAGRR